MANPSPSYRPIEDYAIIGDCGSAALVSREGSIDWLCWPRFDSSFVFGKLIDAEEGGFFQVRPAADFEAKRRYVGATNVLETTFTTDTGTLRLTDLMPAAEHEMRDDTLWPDHEVLRRIECTEGKVDVVVTCDPRLDYGRIRPTFKQRGALGWFCNHRAEVLALRSSIPLSEKGGRLTGRHPLRENERGHVALAYDQQMPAVLPLLGEHADAKIERTLAYWRGWSERCDYDGPYAEAVRRSALTLKLMTFSRSGAVVAAPTTSLPERVGGSKNWDYRYCWIRDSAFTLRVLFELGYPIEEEAFLSWLLQAARTTLPDLNVMYDVFGNPPAGEKELRHLDGYRQSRPVRVGNEAQSQFQLDIYGEIISAACEYVQRGRSLDYFQRRMITKLGKAICKRWKEPDEGIWELRGARRRHTYSLVMCAVGLSRLLDLHEKGLLDVPAERFRAARDDLRKAIEERGFNDDLGSYAATLDGDMMDASLLLLSLYDYKDADDERMTGTWECLSERLGRDGLLYRYLDEDGSDPEEGTFGICGFWAVQYLAQAGRLEEARERFEDLLDYANDLGLFSEEIDPETGAALGNFPQAFTHVGLINAAMQMARAQETEHADGSERGRPAASRQGDS